MKDKDVIEVDAGNKIIADFMGLPCPPKYDNSETGIGYYDASELEYHSSWDWLMNACKKFDRLPDQFDDCVKYELHCDEIDNAVTRYEILEAWQQLVKAIQWYNQTKQQ